MTALVRASRVPPNWEHRCPGPGSPEQSLGQRWGAGGREAGRGGETRRHVPDRWCRVPSGTLVSALGAGPGGDSGRLSTAPGRLGGGLSRGHGSPALSACPPSPSTLGHRCSQAGGSRTGGASGGDGGRGGDVQTSTMAVWPPPVSSTWESPGATRSGVCLRPRSPMPGRAAGWRSSGL